MRLDSNLTTTLYKSFTYLLTYTDIELPQHTVDTFKFWMHVKCIVSYRIGCRTLDPGHALPGHSPIPGKVPPGKGRLSGALVLGGVLFLWGGVVGGECPWGHLPGHLSYINDPGQRRLSGALVLGGTFPVGWIVGSAGGGECPGGHFSWGRMSGYMSCINALLLFGAGMPPRRKRQKGRSSSSAAAASSSAMRSTSVSVKRSRTCFTTSQLARLNDEFAVSHYLTNSRRSLLANQLLVSQLQVKIWFQNQRAKLKRTTRAAANVRQAE